MDCPFTATQRTDNFVRCNMYVQYEKTIGFKLIVLDSIDSIVWCNK